MKLAKLSIALVAGLLTCDSSVGWSQAGLPPEAPNAPGGQVAKRQAAEPREENPQADVPVTRIDFKSDGPIPGVESSPVVSMPIQCTPDGTPLVAVPQPPNYFTQTVFSLDPKGARNFSYTSVAGLYDVKYLGFFPGDSTVDILVNGTTDSKQSQYAVTSPRGSVSNSATGFQGQRADDVLQFELNGNFKRMIALPEAYSFHRIAELGDHNLLAVAYDRVNAVAKLLLLDEDGQVIRPLQIPQAMEHDSALTQGQTGSDLNRARAETSLSWWLFTPSAGRVLLYVAHSKFPVLELGPGGAMREIPLQAPEGYLLDGFIPANDRWMVRFRRENLPDHGAVDRRPESRNYVLYEVNRADGSLKREFKAISGPGFGSACEHDGVLTGFSVSPDSKYIRLTAEIPR